MAATTWAWVCSNHWVSFYVAKQRFLHLLKPLTATSWDSGCNTSVPGCQQRHLQPGEHQRSACLHPRKPSCFGCRVWALVWACGSTPPPARPSHAGFLKRTAPQATRLFNTLCCSSTGYGAGSSLLSTCLLEDTFLPTQASLLFCGHEFSGGFAAYEAVRPCFHFNCP